MTGRMGFHADVNPQSCPWAAAEPDGPQVRGKLPREAFGPRSRRMAWFQACMSISWHGVKFCIEFAKE